MSSDPIPTKWETEILLLLLLWDHPVMLLLLLLMWMQMRLIEGLVDAYSTRLAQWRR